MYLYGLRGFLGGAAMLLGVWALAPSAAQANGIGIGAKAGTLGAGVEASVSLVPSLNLRLGANGFTYDFSDTLDEIRYDAELELDTQSLILDWHPLGGSFRVSAGLVRNGNEASLSGVATTGATIGDTFYSPADIGQISGAVTFDSTASYLGIGWGNAVGKNKRFGFSVDLGVLFQNSPDVTLSTNGLLANDPGFQADLRQEEANIEADVEDFEAYPVISFGFSFRF